jgi:hypothetical protein
MEYQSEKYAIRIKDAIKYGGIISLMYQILHIKFISYLPFLHEINVNKTDNVEVFIKKELINELKERDVPNKILNLYVSNPKFFEKKYSFTKEQIDSFENNELRGIFILDKIYDQLLITISRKETYLQGAIFGLNDIKILDCPLIIQKNLAQPRLEWIPKSVTSYSLNNDLSIDKKFFITEMNKQGFGLFFNVPTKFNKEYLIEEQKQNFYCFDENYKQKIQNNGNGYVFKEEGFHFEKFICFDFDVDNFLSKVEDAKLFVELNQDKKIYNSEFNIYYPKVEALFSEYPFDFETFYYSCLNLCLFLGQPTKQGKTANNVVSNIVINPEYFKKLFPKTISGDAEINSKYLKILQDYFSLFIKNIRYGLRLVSRSDIKQDSEVVTFDKQLGEYYTNYNSQLFRQNQYFTDASKLGKFSKPLEYYVLNEVFTIPSFTTNNFLTPGSSNIIKRNPSSFDSKTKVTTQFDFYSSGSWYETVESFKITANKNFGDLEYLTLKEKSYILFDTEQTETTFDKNTKKSTTNILISRYSWIPLVSVYSDKIFNDSSLDIQEQLRNTNTNYNIEELHDFINDDFGVTIKELKQKIIDTAEFKIVYKKIAALDSLFPLVKLDAASVNQSVINSYLTPEQIQIALENSDKPEFRVPLVINNVTKTAESFFDILLRDNKEY